MLSGFGRDPQKSLFRPPQDPLVIIPGTPLSALSPPPIPAFAALRCTSPLPVSVCPLSRHATYSRGALFIHHFSSIHEFAGDTPSNEHVDSNNAYVAARNKHVGLRARELPRTQTDVLVVEGNEFVVEGYVIVVESVSDTSPQACAGGNSSRVGLVIRFEY